MNAKNLRKKLIKTLFRSTSVPKTVNGVYEELKTSYNLDISRKTIERDLFEMVGEEVLKITKDFPCHFALGKNDHYELILTNEELTYLAVIIPVAHPLNEKVKQLLGI